MATAPTYMVAIGTIDGLWSACYTPRPCVKLVRRGRLRQRLLRPLTVRLGSIIALMHNQILRPIIFLATEVALENALDTSRVPLLSVNRGTAHVWYHCISAAERVLGVAQRVVFRRWLREPDVAAIAAEVTRLQRLGYVFLHDDGAASGIDEP
jgi:hypothetical protein